MCSVLALSTICTTPHAIMYFAQCIVIESDMLGLKMIRRARRVKSTIKS